jgi:hypothetical protein
MQQLAQEVRARVCSSGRVGPQHKKLSSGSIGLQTLKYDAFPNSYMLWVSVRRNTAQGAYCWSDRAV